MQTSTHQSQASCRVMSKDQVFTTVLLLRATRAGVYSFSSGSRMDLDCAMSRIAFGPLVHDVRVRVRDTFGGLDLTYHGRPARASRYSAMFDRYADQNKQERSDSETLTAGRCARPDLVGVPANATEYRRTRARRP